jgi:hypothetical protein
VGLGSHGEMRCYLFWCRGVRSGSHGGVRSGIVVNGEVRQLWTG